MTGPRLPALDGLRGGAALFIAAYHAWLLSGQAPLRDGPWRDALSSGHLAVSLFFVLSGLVLFWPMARAGDTGDGVGFLVRRAARLLPAYYLALLIGVVCFPLLSTGAELSDRVSGWSLLSHLFVVQNEARLIPGYSGELGLGVNPVVWTMTVELACSALLLALAPLMLRRPWLLAGAALSLAFAVRLGLPHTGWTDYTRAVVLSSTPVHFADFACGMAAAVVVARPPAWLGRASAAMAAAGLIVLLVVLGGADGGDVRDSARGNAPAMAAVPILMAVLCASVAVRPIGWLASRPAVWLGRVSYGVFLGHFLLIDLARNTLDFGHDGTTRQFLAMEVFVLAGAVLYGWLSWTLVERPAQAWGRRFSSARTRRSSGSPPPDATPASATESAG